MMDRPPVCQRLRAEQEQTKSRVQFQVAVISRVAVAPAVTAGSLGACKVHSGAPARSDDAISRKNMSPRDDPVPAHISETKCHMILKVCAVSKYMRETRTDRRRGKIR
jgi:hypothetical protein